MRFHRLVAVPTALLLTAIPSAYGSTSGGDAATGGTTAAVSAAAAVARAARPCTVAAAGDVAGKDDWRRGAARTARLIRARHPQRVLALGDLAYEAGSAKDFNRYYRPTWGSFKGKTLAVPGNHEYQHAPAVGFARYFGAASRRDRAVNLCNGWRVVMLNIYRSGPHTAPVAVRRAAAFLTADARRHPRKKLIAMWHAPRFSSGLEHGNEPDVAALWTAAVRAKVRIVLNGHDHDYERFAPVGRGRTVEFVNGLGGHHMRGLRPHIARGSRARFTRTPAVLFLTLRAKGYGWTERTVTGRVVDRGSWRL